MIYNQEVDPNAVGKVTDMIWFMESMTKCNCVQIFILINSHFHLLVFEEHTYSVSQKKKKENHWLVRLLYDWNELSHWHFQNLHKILFYVSTI